MVFFNMNFQQLRFVRETIRHNFNLTEAARALFTSQPGVSKAIIELEQELGMQIFERHGKRLKGLTGPGREVAQTIDRILCELENLKKIGSEYAHHDEGAITIACTHTQARYLLPKVIPRFRKKFPKVHLSLAEGNPEHLAGLVLDGRADIAIATETIAQTPGLTALPLYTWQHTLVVPPEHPLTALTSSAARNLSLEHLAQYQIVTYDRAFSGRKSIDQAFAQAGIVPDIVLEAIDADVIKTYADIGLGVGIIAGVAFDPRRDKGLVGLPVGHLFGTHTTSVGIKNGVFLRDFVFELLAMMAPELSRQIVLDAINQGSSRN